MFIHGCPHYKYDRIRSSDIRRIHAGMQIAPEMAGQIFFSPVFLERKFPRIDQRYTVGIPIQQSHLEIPGCERQTQWNSDMTASTDDDDVLQISFFPLAHFFCPLPLLTGTKIRLGLIMTAFVFQ